MPKAAPERTARPGALVPGRVCAATLARWALVRQITELEDALADSDYGAGRVRLQPYIKNTRLALVAKRAALHAL